VTYRAQVARTAARQLAEGLPEVVAAACAEFLYGPLAENPHRVGSPLRKPFEGHWRARRGEYRVRYTTIDDAAATVHVLDISHRRDAYR
jgi:mRNA interferase RelE/StbE